MYFGNDGGVYRALDGYTGLSVGSCNTPGNNAFDNLNATLGSMTQFVSFSGHPTDQNTVLGGTQDNGSPASTNTTASSQFFTANGGDGGYSVIDATNNLWYTANTDVSVQVCSTPPSCTTNSFNGVVTAGSATIGNDHGAFYSPYILDPQNADELLVGTCRVWRGSTAGTGFTALGPNFDTGTSGTCAGNEVNQVRSIVAGGAKNSSGFSSVVYATTDGTGPNCTSANGCTGPLGGEVWVTTTAGSGAMSNVTDTINPSHFTISSVALDTTDTAGSTAYVGIMGFGGSHVFKTTNAGVAWTDWTGTGLPDAPVNTLLVDALAGMVYAGTDVGVFVSTTSSAAWTEVGPAAAPGALGYLPNVPVSALRMFSSGGTKKLRASTYGRGIWEYALAVAPDFTNAISNSPQTVFPAQSASFNGTLTALGTFNSAVNLSCAGTHPTTCTLNPTQVTPTAGGASYALTAGGVVGNYSFTAHGVGTDSNTTTRDAAIVLQVTDLTAPNPGSITAPQGLTSNATSFQVAGGTGFSGTVGLSCSGLPAGTGCNFSSNAVTPPQTVTLTVSTTGSTPQGNSVVTITATAPGGASKTQTFTLTVEAPPDFTWTTSSTTSHAVLAGQQTLAYNFTAMPPSGQIFAAGVTLGCSGLPDATAVCVFSPSSIAAGSGTTPVSLAITTTGPNTGMGAAGQRRAGKRLPGVRLVLPIAGLLLAGFAGRKVSRHSAFAGLCALLAMIGIMLACGGGGSSGSPPPPPAISVSITPSTAIRIYANEAGNAWAANLTQQSFTATVNNSTNQTVNWQVNGVAGGNATFGAIDNNGVYSAPTVVPSPATFSVTGVAQADTSKFQSDQITILAPTVLGSFNVTVTASEGTIMHSQGVTLTVQ